MERMQAWAMQKHRPESLLEKMWEQVLADFSAVVEGGEEKTLKMSDEKVHKPHLYFNSSGKDFTF